MVDGLQHKEAVVPMKSMSTGKGSTSFIMEIGKTVCTYRIPIGHSGLFKCALKANEFHMEHGIWLFQSFSHSLSFNSSWEIWWYENYSSSIKSDLYEINLICPLNAHMHSQWTFNYFQLNTISHRATVYLYTHARVHTHTHTCQSYRQRFNLGGCFAADKNLTRSHWTSFKGYRCFRSRNHEFKLVLWMRCSKFTAQENGALEKKEDDLKQKKK